MKCHIILYVFLALEMCNCDLKKVLRRHRSLVYPDPRGSETKVQVLFGLGLPMESEMPMTLGYVLKCNYNLPYNSSTYTSPSHISTLTESTSQQEKQLSRVSRWNLYRILESLVSRSCLLRVVCEVAELPFSQVHGNLMGQLLQTLLQPSTTTEEYDIYKDREYHAAEHAGRYGDCTRFNTDCSYSPLEYFTKIINF